MALVNLAAYEAKAREILPLPVFDYYYGGAHDESVVAAASGPVWFQLWLKHEKIDPL